MKKLILFLVLVFTIFTFVIVPPIGAQTDGLMPAFGSHYHRSPRLTGPIPEPAPSMNLNPSISSRNYFGFEAGLTYSFMQGNKNFFFTLTESNFTYVGPVAFDNLGSGIGFLAGGVLDLSLSDFFGLQGKLRYFTNMTGNTENQKLPVIIFNSDGTTTNKMADVEDRYTLSLSNLGVSVLGRLQFIPNSFYGLVGLGYSTVLSNTIDLHQRFIDTSLSYFDQNTKFLTPFHNIDQTSSSKNFNSRGDVQVGFGTFIPAGSTAVITPELLLSIPLTTLLNSTTESNYSASGVTTPKLWYLALSVGVKFPFGETSEESVATRNTTNDFNSTRLDDEGRATLTGRVMDRKTNKSVDANMTVTDLNSNEVVGTSETDNDGYYTFKVKAPGRYSITADAKGYLFGSAYYEIDKDGRLLRGPKEIRISEATGSTRLLIFFDFDKSSLQRSSYPELNRAVQLMKANPDMNVEIAGYTDSKGTPSYNLDLSQRRANTVKDYLLDHGIGKSRVIAKGYGQDSPVESNDTEEGRAENRRVEFVVMNR